MLGRIVRQEGYAALWSGIAPAVARGLTYGGTQADMFLHKFHDLPIKDRLSWALLHNADSHHGHQGATGPAAWPGLVVNMAAGMASGGFAALLTSPSELIKVCPIQLRLVG